MLPLGKRKAVSEQGLTYFVPLAGFLKESLPLHRNSPHFVPLAGFLRPENKDLKHTQELCLATHTLSAPALSQVVLGVCIVPAVQSRIISI